ncbi:MAG: LEA type 2 family protein [Flavihumibacter sp.]
MRSLIFSTACPGAPFRPHRVFMYLLSFTLCLAAACKRPQIPEYQAFDNFELAKISMGESVVSADLKYYNPNPYPLQLKRANLAISINDKPVGTTVLDTLIQIPKLDTFYVPVKMKVDMKQLLSNALSMLLSDGVNVKVNGTIKMGRGGFFFNVPVNYEGRQEIKW